jgi:hypothetical protein
VDFTAMEDSGQMVLEETADISLASRLWFDVKNPDFILQPGELEKVNFKLTIPEDAERGGYYSVLIFEPRLPSFYFEEGALIKNIPQIGVLFLTSVGKFTLEPETSEKIQIVDFSLPKEKRLTGLENFIKRGIGSIVHAAEFSIVEGPFLNFILKIKNNDIYHIRPSGHLLIYNIFGKVVGDIEIPKRTILPGKTRIFPADFAPEIPDRLKFLPASVSNFLVKNFFVGKYVAELDLEAETGFTGEIIKPETKILLTFFSLPWKFWLLFILILTSAIILFVKYRNRIRKAIKIIFSKKRPAENPDQPLKE